MVGRDIEMPGEPGDIVDVAALRLRGEVTLLHVFDHAVAKRGHLGKLLGLKWVAGNNLFPG